MTTELLDHAVELAATMLPVQPSCVIVMAHGDVRRSFIHPGMTNAVWEAECAMGFAGATQAVLVAPVMLDEGQPEEILHIVSVDLAWGLDVYRCLVNKGGDDEGSEQAVGPVERFTGQIHLHPRAPGYVLIQAMRAYQEDDREYEAT